MSDLDKIREKLLKKYGEETNINLQKASYEVTGIPTGSFLLDYATGIGGFPRGRITELFGLESTGKSTLCLCSIVQCQAMGLPALYMDFENSFVPSYGESLGADLSPDKFIYVQPDSLEQGLDVLSAYCEEPTVGIAVIDSLAAMSTLSEMNESKKDGFGKASYNTQLARSMGSYLKRLLKSLTKAGTSLVFINHLHQQIGGNRYDIVTPGGKAVDYMGSLRISLSKSQRVKGKGEDWLTGDEVDDLELASRVVARVVKNKVAIPNQKGYFYFEPGKGIVEARAVLDVAVHQNIIDKRASWYVIPSSVDGGESVRLQGEEKVVSWLKDNPEEYAILRQNVLSCLGNRSSDGLVSYEDEIEEGDYDNC